MRIKGELIENRIIVWDIEDSRKLYSSGFYGKPLGIPKPKDFNFSAPLILDLVEGYYLFEKGILEIYKSGKKVNAKELRKLCRREYVDFDLKYRVYKVLRDSGLIVTPGIKFGSDFAVYKKGPGLEHAPFLIQVFKPTDNITATQVVLAGRLATTVRKHIILAIASRNRVHFLGLEWWKP